MSKLSKGGSIKPSVSSFFDLEGDHVRRYLWVSDFARAKSVIDVGCGHGYGSDFLSNMATSVLGIDSDLEAIEYAQLHYSRPNLSFKLADVESDQINGSFDVAVSFEVLEHLHHPEKYLNNVRSCLRSSGVFFLSTPNKLHSERSYIEGRSQNRYHVKEFYPQECRDLLSRYFKVESIFHEYANSGREERIAQAASRAPKILRKLVPYRLRLWYSDWFVAPSTKGAYDDYVIEKVDSAEQIDSSRPTQLYRLSPLS